MTRHRLSTPVLLLLGSSLALASGCAEQGGSPSQPEIPGSTAINLEDEFGGYTSEKEQPAFGDPDLATTSDLEEQFVDDPTGQDPYVGALEGDPRATMYSMTITWGQLFSGRLTTSGSGSGINLDAMDWSGSLRVTRGAIVVQRVVAFEPGDYLVMPRADRRSIEWVSHTSGGYDGIRVLVLQAPPDSNLSMPDSVYFATGPHAQGFPIADLADLSLVVDVDDAGNQVCFSAGRMEGNVSAGGWLAGEWRWAEGDSLGHFLGRWVGLRGGVMGFVRGHYGIDNSGKRVFFGKYIDRTGNFQGFLRGVWEVRKGDGHQGLGTFRGQWHDADGTPKGTLGGEWEARPGWGGFFNGRWCAGCS
jgi:hypothetical protein